MSEFSLSNESGIQDGAMTKELLGDVEFGNLDKSVFSGDSGMSEWSLLTGEKAAAVFFGEIGMWDLTGMVFSGDALWVRFAFLLRYLGRTLSSQYKCHRFAV